MDPKHKNDDLDLLTEEERAGLEDEDFIDEGQEGTETGDDGALAEGDDAGGDKPDDDIANGDGTKKEEPAVLEPPVEDDTATKQPEAGAETPAPAADDTSGKNPTPPARRSWQVPTEVTEKITSLEEEKDRLAEQWDDGELTGKEHREKLKAIDTELDALKEQRMYAKVALNTAVTAYTERTVPDFLNQHPEYKTGVLRGLIDVEIRNLQQTAADPFSAELLEQAHENLRSQVSKAYGVEGKAAPAHTPKPATPAPKREIPPTLGGIPAADATDADDGGEFGYLDRLANSDIEKYEVELGRLSDEKRDRYLSM